MTMPAAGKNRRIASSRTTELFSSVTPMTTVLPATAAPPSRSVGVPQRPA
jgi:hypothetical protein